MWRQNMDRMMQRLLVDIELARHPALQEHGHQMVCEQFDRMYDWYLHNGKKEVHKERPGPAFLRFDALEAAMPGSLRSSEWERGAGHSALSGSKSARGP